MTWKMGTLYQKPGRKLYGRDNASVVGGRHARKRRFYISPVIRLHGDVEFPQLAYVKTCMCFMISFCNPTSYMLSVIYHLAQGHVCHRMGFASYAVIRNLRLSSRWPIVAAYKAVGGMSCEAV